MAGTENVKLSISIQIDETDDDIDMGMTVEQWNALSDAEREGMYLNVWHEMASRNNGGVTVLTPGAKEV